MRSIPLVSHYTLRSALRRSSALLGPLEPRLSGGSDSFSNTITVDNPSECELYDPFVDDEGKPPRYTLRSGAKIGTTYDSLLRCVRRYNRASDESDSLEKGASSADYALPRTETPRLEEERLWTAALLCTTMDWMGRGDEASFTDAVEIFTKSWTPRNSVKPPTVDFVKKTLLPIWRERYDGAGDVFDLLEQQKTSGSKLKTVIVRLLKDGSGPSCASHLSANLTNVPLPLTPELLRLHSHLLAPTARFLDGRNTRGSVADSLPESSESEYTDPSEDGEASEPPYLIANPFLNRYRYIEAIPDSQKDAVSEEQQRFLTNRDPRKAFQYAHILPKRPERSPVIFALKNDILHASGSVLLSFFMNHSSNFLPLPKDAHDNFDNDYTSFLPVSRTLDILLQLVKEDEKDRLEQAAKGNVVGPGEAFQKLLSDSALCNIVFPLHVNVLILADKLFVVDDLTVIGEEWSTTYRAARDGQYRAERTDRPLPPQLISRLDPLHHRHPNPFLLVISTAIKVILNPQRALPTAFRDDILVALELFVRLFRTSPTYSLQDSENPFLDALATAAIETSTPKKHKKKAVAKELFVRAKAVRRQAT